MIDKNRVLPVGIVWVSDGTQYHDCHARQRGVARPQGTAFVGKLAEFLHKDPYIRTYVLTGYNTFSSAINNTMDFKRMGINAVIVGEETSGKPNHFGDIKFFNLPSPGLVFYQTF